MHQLLDEYLCKKYPKIFVERNMPPGASCMHWGLAINDGWYYLIDNLCHNIQSYIDNPPWVLKNDGSGLYEPPPEGTTTCEQVVAKQVKEKFSGLRFYYTGGDKYVKGLVDGAQRLSHYICEDCGEMNWFVGRNDGGWIKTTCKKHARDLNVFKTNVDYEPELAEVLKKIKEEGPVKKKPLTGNLTLFEAMFGKYEEDS